MSSAFQPYTDTKTYHCTPCQKFGMARLEGFDRFWICSSCQKPIEIEMQHPQAGICWVNRIPAAHLQAEDELAQENKRSLTTQVITSGKAQGKGNKWFLALQEIGGVTVEPDRLYDRVI
jgi:ribosomal protein L37AE/L43A